MPVLQLVHADDEPDVQVAQSGSQIIHLFRVEFLNVPAGHVATQVLDVVNANGEVQEVQLDEEAAVHVAHEVSQL